MSCVECTHTECACDCETCEATRQAAALGTIAPCGCHPCSRAREQTHDFLSAALKIRSMPSSQSLVTFAYNPEIGDIEARLKLLRAASRPSEPLTVLAAVLEDWTGEPIPAALTGRSQPTAQGHILSAITQLERRRAELLGKGPR